MNNHFPEEKSNIYSHQTLNMSILYLILYKDFRHVIDFSNFYMLSIYAKKTG